MTEQRTCAACGGKVDDHAAFCSSCGAAQATGDSTRPAVAPSGWALATAAMDQPTVADTIAGPVRKSECAGWWRRLWAWFLDGIILLTVFGSIVAAVAGVAYAVQPTVFDDARTALEEAFDDAFASAGNEYEPGTSADPFADVDDELVWWFAGLAIAGLLLSVAWDVLWVRSRFMGKPGQRAAGFRVVSLGAGERLGTGRSVARAAAKLLYNVPQFGGLVTLASAFTIGLSRRKQGLHDLISGTACIKGAAWDRRCAAAPGAEGATATSAPGVPGAPGAPGTYSTPGAPGTREGTAGPDPFVSG